MSANPKTNNEFVHKTKTLRVSCAQWSTDVFLAHNGLLHMIYFSFHLNCSTEKANSNPITPLFAHGIAGLASVQTNLALDTTCNRSTAGGVVQHLVFKCGSLTNGLLCFLHKGCVIALTGQTAAAAFHCQSQSGCSGPEREDGSSCCLIKHTEFHCTTVSLGTTYQTERLATEMISL